MSTNDNIIKCERCRATIFKIFKSESFNKHNGYIMLECMECGHVFHEEIKK